MAFDFRRTRLSELVGQVRRREVASRELVEHALERIETLNPHLNAFVAVDADGARAQAAHVDERLARGDDVGPLAGIPIGVKDLEDARGFVTAKGNAFHASLPPASADSVQVARLRAAGCVIVGKTNSPEFGLRGETDNPVFGITRNPWDDTRTSGGSSGGSSAALASGMVPLATGSDGGGSIRIPSAATGLSGLKPTQGWVPAGDTAPVSWQDLSTRGPMARRIADVAYALDVVTGPDANDFRSLPARSSSWGDAVREPLRPVRVGWSPTLGYANVDSEVRAVCEGAVEALANEGVDVVEIPTVFSADPNGPLGTLVSAYIRRTTEPMRGTEWWDRLDPLVVVSAELSRLTVRDPLTLIEAEDGCHRFNLELQRALDGVDVLLAPTTAALPPPCENHLTVEQLLAALGPVLMASAAGSLGASLDDLQGLLALLRDKEPLNVPLGVVDGQPAMVWHGMTGGFNLCRAPAGTVCAGFSSSGLPVGLQVVGRRLDDVTVLRVLAHLEELLGLDPIAPV